VGLALDLTGVRPHFLYRPRLTPDQLLPALRRWADRRGCVAAAGAAAPRLAYYPFWRYAQDGPHRLVPAWPTLEPAWGRLSPPDAEQAFFDLARTAGASVVEASVPEAAARARSRATREGDLVHLPVYETTVRVGGVSLPISVEACAGEVIWPEATPPPGTRRSGRPIWMLGGGLGMLLAAALIPPLGIVLPLLTAAAALVYVGLLGRGAAGRG
jgi:hypothetical protein